MELGVSLKKKHERIFSTFPLRILLDQDVFPSGQTQPKGVNNLTQKASTSYRRLFLWPPSRTGLLKGQNYCMNWLTLKNSCLQVQFIIVNISVKASLMKLRPVMRFDPTLLQLCPDQCKVEYTWLVKIKFSCPKWDTKWTYYFLCLFFKSSFHFRAEDNSHLFWFCITTIGPIKNQTQSRFDLCLLWVWLVHRIAWVICDWPDRVTSLVYHWTGGGRKQFDNYFGFDLGFTKVWDRLSSLIGK